MARSEYIGVNEEEVLIRLNRYGIGDAPIQSEFVRYKGDYLSLRSLMKKGYVDRFKFLNHRTGRRVFGYHLTPKGRRFTENLLKEKSKRWW